MRAMWRLLGVAVATGLICGIVAGTATAGLTLHVRLPHVEQHPGEDNIPDDQEYGMNYNAFQPPPQYSRAAGAPEYVTNDPGAQVTGGQGINGGAVEVVDPAQVVNVQVWAVITNGDGDPANDGLKKVFTSLFTSNPADRNDPRGADPGIVHGNLTNNWSMAATEQDFTGDGIPDIRTWAADMTFQSGTGTTVGNHADRDTDGDVDVGGAEQYYDDASPNTTISAVGWANAAKATSEPFQEGQEFLLFDAQLQLTDWVNPVPGDRYGVTKIWARSLPTDAGGWWMEDGVEKFESPNQDGEAVVLYIGSNGDAGATTPGQVVGPGEALQLDGSLADGSVNWWKWVFDGGAYETAGGAGEEVLDVGFDELVAALGEGAHQVMMQVGYTASDVVITGESAPIDFTLVPEPATLALLGMGLAALARRKK